MRWSEGSVGYVIANIKDASEIQIGDTLTLSKNPAEDPLPGFQGNPPDGLFGHLSG